MSKIPDREIIHRRPRAEVRASAERLAKMYTDHLRQGEPPLSLAGLTPVERRRVLEEEEKVFAELEAAGKPVKRRMKKPRKAVKSEDASETSKTKSAPKRTKGTSEKKVKVTPEHQTQIKRLKQRARKIEVTPDEKARLQKLEQMFDDFEQKSSELMRREASLKVRESAVRREEAELINKRKNAEREAAQIIATAQMNADGITKRIREAEKKANEALRQAQMATPEEKAKAEAAEEVVQARQEAKQIYQENLDQLAAAQAKIALMFEKANVEAAELRAKNQAIKALQADLAMTMGLPKAEAEKFLALASNPPLTRTQIANRLEIYTNVYQNLSPRIKDVPSGGFYLHKTNHIQGAGGYSVKWAPSSGEAPLAAPEAEVLLRILASTLTADQNPHSGMLEIAFISKDTRKAKPVLNVLLPGGNQFLDRHHASTDMLVRHSMEQTTKDLLANYPEKIGWQCAMNGSYRFGRLAVKSGCFVLSFAANYHQDTAKKGVLGVFIAMICALSYLAVERGEMKGVIAGNDKSSATALAILRRTASEFDDLMAPEIQGWNAWCQSFKPNLWRVD